MRDRNPRSSLQTGSLCLLDTEQASTAVMHLMFFVEVSGCIPGRNIVCTKAFCECRQIRWHGKVCSWFNVIKY